MNTVLLDTGPLLEYILFGMIQRHPSRRKSIADYVDHFKSDRDVNSFQNFLQQYSRRETVSGVLAELHSHFCRLENKRVLSRQDRQAIWSDVQATWNRFDVAEQLMPLATLDLSILSVDGPVDVALMQLALRHRGAHEEVVLLTCEQNSYGRWQKLGVPVVWLPTAIERGAS